MNSIEFNSRFEKASKILDIKEEDLKSYLNKLGVSEDEIGFQLLEADITTEEMISGAIVDSTWEKTQKELPAAKLKAAVKFLKGQDPFAKKEVQSNSTVINNYSGIEQAMKNSIPVVNRKNKDLLEEFILDEDMGIQQELNRRADGRPFIILDKNGKISLDLSLDLLRKACRGDHIPDMIPVGQDRVAVYPIQSFRKENRVKEESPMVQDQPLFDGYCEVTDENFKEIDMESRQFMRLVVDFTNSSEFKNSKFHSFNLKSFSDRKALMASASKGIQDLRKTWPSVALIFDDKKELGTLPSLKIVNPIVRKKSDPFHTNGNQTY